MLILHLFALAITIIGTFDENPIDNWVRRMITRWLQRYFSKERRKLWANALLGVMLSLSDQQLITGIAILVVAFVRMETGNLSVYHFQICTDMAWFSSATHMATLDLVGHHFRRHEKPFRRSDTLGTITPSTPKRKHLKRRSYLLWFRICCMSIMAILFVIALVISGDRWWFDYREWSCPVKCVFANTKKVFGGTNAKFSIAQIILTCYTYPWTIIQLLDDDNFIFRLGSKLIPAQDEALQAWLRPRPLLLTVYKVLRAITLTIWFIFDSMPATVVFS